MVVSKLLIEVAYGPNLLWISNRDLVVKRHVSGGPVLRQAEQSSSIGTIKSF